jgi:transcriptional regulator with XRE-family HTH domain
MQQDKITNFYQSIGLLIKEAREVNEITQELLASQLGLSRASIINLEKGRHRISLHLLIEIADFLQVNYTTLIPVDVRGISVIKKPFDMKNMISDEKVSSSTRAAIKSIISSI